MEQLLELTSSDSTLVFVCSNAVDEITGMLSLVHHENSDWKKGVD